MLNLNDHEETRRKNSGNHLMPPTTVANASRESAKEGLTRSTSIPSFHIIDEKEKDSSSDFDDESSDDNISLSANVTFNRSHSGFISKCFSRSIIVQPSEKINYSASQPKMTTSASRFKIVPVESKYKRGRWECWDSYEENHAKKTSRHNEEGYITPAKVTFAISNGSSPTNTTSINRQAVSHPAIAVTPPVPKPASHTPEMTKHLGVGGGGNGGVQVHPPVHQQPGVPAQQHAAPPHHPGHLPPQHQQQAPTFLLEDSDDSDRENLPSFDDQPHQLSRRVPANRVQMRPQENAPPKAHPAIPTDYHAGAVLRASPDLASMSGRITPSELLQQYGLERSLSVAYDDHKILANPVTTTITTTSGIGNGANNMSWTRTSVSNQPQVGHPATTTGVPGTAIDSKIEQAMDLVKTHLMYAVREEIEQLRNRIMDLETTVIQLEAENSILREHVPADILKNLNLSSTQPTAVAQ